MALIDDLIQNTPLKNQRPTVNVPEKAPDEPSPVPTPKFGPESYDKDEPQVKSKWQKVKEGAVDTATGIVEAVQPQVEGAINLVTPEGSRLDQILKQRHEQRQKDWDTASQRSPIMSRMGYWGTLLTSGAAVPGGVAGSVGKRMATGALTGAGLGVTQYTPDDNGAKMAARGLLGGTLGAAVPAGIGALAGTKGMLMPGTSKGAQQAADAVQATADVTGARTPGGITNPIIESAQRQGVTVSPAQALDSPALAAEIGGRKVPFETRLKMTDATTRAEQQARDKVGETIESMVPEGATAAKKAAGNLYNQLRDKPINPSALGDVQTTVPYQTALKQVEQQYPDLNPSSVGFQQKIAENMYDTASAMKREQNPNNFEIKNILENRRQLVDSIGKEYPQYKDAQHIWERVQLQKDLTEQLGSRKVLAGRSDLTPAQIRSTLAGSDEQKSEFLQSIKRAGGNGQQATDVLNILEGLSRPSGFKGVINDAASGGINSSNPKAALWESITSRVGGREKRDQGFIDLMMNPKWTEKVASITRIQNPHEMADKLAQTLIRASVGSGVQQLNKSSTRNPTEDSSAGFQEEDGLIKTMPLGFKQERAMGKAKEQEQVQDYQPDSITDQVIQDPEDRKKLQDAVKKLPEEKQDEVDQLLNMSGDEFYKNTLSTKEGQAQYLKTLRDKGYDITLAYKHIKEIEQLDRMNKDAEAKLAVIQDPKQHQQIMGGMQQRTQKSGGLLGALFSLFASIFTGNPVGVFGKGGQGNINSYKNMTTEQLEAKAAKPMKSGGLLSRMGNQGTAEAKLELRTRKTNEVKKEHLDKIKNTISNKRAGLLSNLMSSSLKLGKANSDLKIKAKNQAATGKSRPPSIKKVRIKF